MSINDTVLTGELLEALYKNQLVLPVAAQPTTETYAVLGRNQRRICLLIDCAGTAFLPEQHLNFVSRLLDACHLSPDDIVLVNQASARVRIDALIAQLRPLKLLLFGVPATAIGISTAIADFEHLEQPGCMVHAFPALDLINQAGAAAQGLKKQLWTALKTMFGI